MGGLTVTAEAARVTVTSVQRWRLPREKGGTGGHVPMKHVQSILDAAHEAGVGLDFSDFAPKPVEAAE